jgi:peptidoglycan hydrolase CwlO-like protein
MNNQQQDPTLETKPLVNQKPTEVPAPQSQLQSLVDKVDALDKKIDRISDRLDNLAQRVGSIASNVPL